MRRGYRRPRPQDFPEVEWHGQVVDVVHRPKKQRHVSHGLFDPVKRRKLKGKQALVTQPVRDFAREFDGRSMKTVLRIIQAVKRFKIIRVPAGDVKYFYGRRTAEDIIHTKTIIALDKKGILESHMHLHGCIDHALALLATLRAKGLKAEFVRESGHSWVMFELEGKKYRADPSFTGRWASPVMEVSPLMEQAYREKIKEGSMAVGKDAWDLGIYSINDYAKYIPDLGEAERRQLKELK